MINASSSSNKWGGSAKMDVSEQGKYEGWTLEDLRKKLKELKDSGPHAKGSKEYEQQNEIEFAIRAKTGWGKVTSSVDNAGSDSLLKSAIGKLGGNARIITVVPKSDFKVTFFFKSKGPEFKGADGSRESSKLLSKGATYSLLAHDDNLYMYENDTWYHTGRVGTGKILSNSDVTDNSPNKNKPRTSDEPKGWAGGSLSTNLVNVSAGASIVSNKEEILPLLNKAVASGYKASFQYMIASELVRGNEGSEIAEALDTHSKDDQEDVRAILKRIIELEGQPIIEFDVISEVSPAFRAPKDISTVAIVKQTLEAESDAIKLYTEILTLAKESNDFATVELFQGILKGEVEQERIFQNFLEDLTK